MLELERAAHQAMIRCSDDYQKVAGQWLWRAPEYLLTTYLYQGLAGQPLATMVRPEHSIADLTHKAGIRGRGLPPGVWRHDGRADLTFWNNQDQPTGLIEVKCPVSAYCAIKNDHERVESIYRRYADQSSIRFCGLAFYADQADGVRKLASDRVVGSVTSIRAQFKCDHHARTRSLYVDDREYRIYRFKNTDKDVTFSYILTDVREEESSWATCLVLWHR